MAVESVCVVGAGAIGSLFAGHLATVADVSVLVRREEQARALAGGLRVSGKSELNASVTAAVDPAALPDPDLCILACKATQLDAVARSLAGRFPRAAVMTVQNGLGAEAVVARYGTWPVISAVTFMSGVRHDDAHVEYELDTATWLGPWAGTATDVALVRDVAATIVASGLRAEAFDDLRPAQWSKLIFNSAVNTVAGLTGLPHVRSFAEREAPDALGHVVHALVAEGVAVARAAGVELYEDPWEMNCRAVERGETDAAGGAYAHLPSMLEDIRDRRRTEVDAITGALVLEAERLGVSTPLNAGMWRLVKGREASWALESRMLGAVSA